MASSLRCGTLHTCKEEGEYEDGTWIEEQEESLTGKVKFAVREAVEEMRAGEIQALKAIEASNSAVKKLSGDIAQQAEVGRRLQGRMDATSANIRAANEPPSESRWDGGQITEV